MRASQFWLGGEQNVFGWDNSTHRILRWDLPSDQVTVTIKSRWSEPAASGGGLHLVHEAGEIPGPVTAVIRGPDETVRRRLTIESKAPMSAFDWYADRDLAIIAISGELFFQGPDEEIEKVAVSPNVSIRGVAIAADEDRIFVVSDALYVLSLSSRNVLLKMPLDFPGIIRRVSWDPSRGQFSVLSHRALGRWQSEPDPNLASR